jgi:NADH-quinone oxidoreductase subunit N
MTTIPFILAAIGLPFIPGWLELRPFIGDLVLILTIIAVLLTPFFVARPNIPTALVSLVGLAIAFVGQLAVGAGDGVVGEHFRGILVADQFAHLWKLILLLFVMGVILMWFTTVAHNMHEGDGPEFFALLLSATLGMSLMASTHNLLMLFLAVELASLPSYVLAGFRKTHRVGAEASLKYVLFGAATSSVMVYGLSYLYGLYGSLNVVHIATAMGQTGSMGIGGAALLAVAVFGLIVGIGFKISAVPFHFWCPDVFEGASIDVTTFLSVASKGAALVLLLRVLTLIANGLGYQGHAGGVSLTAIAITIGVLGAITCTVGNTGALVQNNIKRLLAYSSIAHAGYMLCALSLLVKYKADVVGAHGSTLQANAAQAILLYLAVYLFMNLGAFTVAALVYRATGSENINDYAALGRRAPVAAAVMTACMFSLIGLPPFAGFAAKFNLMQVLGANGGWWWALVAVIGVNTIVSLYYYVRVVKVMYLSPSDAGDVAVNPLGLGLAVACAAALLLMFIGYAPIDRLTTSYGRIYSGQTTAAAPTIAPARAVPAALGATTRPAQTAMTPRD